MQSPIVFKRWSKKKFAVFNSLKKCITIGVLAFTYNMVAVPKQCRAQGDTLAVKTNRQLDEITVSDDRPAQLMPSVARNVSVLNKTDIERAAAQSPDELLEILPMVDIRQRGANGMQSDISIQGGTYDQSIVLINGINLSDPQTGHHHLNLPFDLESIERVEVLKGPSARIYGANAFTGAVNFITGSSKGNKIAASLAAGDFGFHKESLSFSIAANKIQNSVSASNMQSNGYRHNTSFKTKSLFYELGAEAGKFKILSNIGISNKEWGSNSFYSAKFPDQYEETETLFGAIKAETGTRLKHIFWLLWRSNSDHYLLNRNNPAMYENFHLTTTLGASYQFTAYTRMGKIAVGLNYRDENLYSNRLGMPISDSIKIKSTNHYYTFGDTRQNTGLYLDHRVEWESFTFSAGVMADQFNKEVSILPGAEMAYKFTPQIKSFASVNMARRNPTFTDLYYSGPMNIGNLDLKPEKSTSWEIGAEAEINVLKWKLAGFTRNSDNLIDWIFQDDSQKWKTLNITKIQTYGLEVETGYNPAGNRFFKQLVLSYSYLTSSKIKEEVQSYYLLDYVRHSFKAFVSHAVIKNMQANWQLYWTDRNGTFQEYNPLTNSYSEKSYKACFLVNLKLEYRIRNFTVYTEAFNVFNTTIFDIGNLPQPGRWTKAGLKYSLEWE